MSEYIVAATLLRAGSARLGAAPNEVGQARLRTRSVRQANKQGNGRRRVKKKAEASLWWLTVVDVVAPGGSCSGSRLSSALASAPPRSRGLSRPLLLLLQPPLSLASIIPVVFSLVERLPEGFCRTQLATSAQQQKAVRRGQASKLRARIQAMAKRFQCSAYSAAGGVIATPSWNGEWRKGWARACPLAFLRRDTRPE